MPYISHFALDFLSFLIPRSPKCIQEWVFPPTYSSIWREEIQMKSTQSIWREEIVLLQEEEGYYNGEVEDDFDHVILHSSNSFEDDGLSMDAGL